MFNFNKKRGQAAIMVTICLIGIISLLALVVDTGRIFVEHAKLQRGVDAAVLAAAQDLPLGKDGSDETIIKDIIMSSLAANLNVAEQTYKKDDNLNDFMLFTTDTEEKSATRKGDDVTDENQYNIDIQYITPANSLDGKKSVVSLTVSKVIDTRMASFLGYDEWTISAQQIAIIGPIQTVPEILPLGILVDSDIHGKPNPLPLNQIVRLSNTKHDSHSPNQLTYVPIYALDRQNKYGQDIKPFEGYTVPNRTSVANTTFNGSGNRFVYTSDVKNAQELMISNKAESENTFLGICDGLNSRLEKSIFQGSVGCINVDESTAGDMNYNFTIGSSNSMYGYIEDPRMFILPVIQYSTNYTVHISDNIKKRQREFKIIGFALFFCEYAHYTSSPPTTEYYLTNGEEEPPSMTELVGYFTTAVFEGPIDPTTRDYGISGIQYVSALDEEIFDINYN